MARDARRARRRPAAAELGAAALPAGRGLRTGGAGVLPRQYIEVAACIDPQTTARVDRAASNSGVPAAADVHLASR